MCVDKLILSWQKSFTLAIEKKKILWVAIKEVLKSTALLNTRNLLFFLTKIFLSCEFYIIGSLQNFPSGGVKFIIRMFMCYTLVINISGESFSFWTYFTWRNFGDTSFGILNSLNILQIAFPYPSSNHAECSKAFKMIHLICMAIWNIPRLFP